MIKKFDFLVVGSGIAGMSFALKVADKGSVAIYARLLLRKLIQPWHKVEFPL